MKLILIEFLICFLFSNNAKCQTTIEQQPSNKNSMQHYSTRYDNDHQVFDLNTSMPLYETIFATHHYKMPDEKLFQQKILEHCGVDISKVKDNDAPFPTGDGDVLPIIMDKRFLLTYSQDIEPTLEQVASGKAKDPAMDACVDYNKIMFYDDLSAIADVMHIDDDYYAAHFLVIYLKYEKNNLLTQKAIRQIGDINNDNKLTISNIFFYHFNTRPEGKRYRRDFVRQILHQYEGLAYSNIKSVLDIFITGKLENYPFTQDEKDRYICYFLEECLSIAGWGVGDTRSQCYSDTAFSQRIAKKNYYGLPLLIALSKNTNLVYTADKMNERDLPAMEFGKFPMGDVPFKALHGIINDPDGYVNVRNEKNTSSDIKDKIVRGEEFLYWEDKSSDWWKVMTKNIIYGYVHKSRIQKAD